jgi:hypothetical protein
LRCADGKIIGVDTIADPERVRRVAAAVLTAETATPDLRTSDPGDLCGVEPSRPI